MQKNRKSITDLIVEYFKLHPKQDLSHGPIVDWVEARYRKLYDKKPRDTWRAIRQLYEKGFLIKVKKGIYRYDSDFVRHKELDEFTEEQKKYILERDGYKCVVCGKGKKDGVELQVDHIKPKHFGGKATLENGQTMCAQHNFMKKLLKQTETGKKMFLRFYELAKKENDEHLLKFFSDILQTYEKYDINGHIVWKK